jgi:iron-sulfur cluster assembly protein
METTLNEVVTLTPKAVKAVKDMIVRKKLGDAALRLSVEKGGCTGMSYALKFDTEASEADLASEVEGVHVWVDRESATYLQGMSLDFSDDLVGGGFKFLNPNAKKTCGCGESFST